MKKYFFYLFFISVSILGRAQELDKTLLWKITPPESEITSYIFGTYHLLCADHFEIKTKVQNAFASSDELVVEINFNDPNEMLQMQMSLYAEESVFKKFSEKQKKDFEAGIKNYGYEIHQLENFSTMAIYSMLTSKLFPCPPQDFKMIDFELMNMAKKENKKVIGLESVAEQSKVFENLFEPKDLVYLANNFGDMKSSMIKIQDMYIKEDLPALAMESMEESQMSKKQMASLMDDRNKKWMMKLPDLMKEKKIFIAVGAGHLSGKKGLLTLLKAKGYAVEPVMK